MALPGYSGTPLAKKLGIRESALLHLFHDLQAISRCFRIVKRLKFATVRQGHKDLVHFFTKDMTEFEKAVVTLGKKIFPEGMIWVSWPKKASCIVTNVTEDLIRNVASNIGLVDVKVCAIDETWSGLKLVDSLKERKINP